MPNDVKLDLTKIDYNDIRIDAKLQAVKSALFNEGGLTDVNFPASNLNTLIDIITYFSTLSSMELHLKINEMFLGTAKLDKSVYNLIKGTGFYPKTYLPSKVTLNIRFTSAMSEGSVIKVKPSSDSEYSFYHVLDNDVTANEEIYLQFREGMYNASPKIFFIDNTSVNLANKINLQDKWKIDYNSLKVVGTVSDNKEIIFSPIDTNFDLTSYVENTDKFYYFIDYSNEDNLTLRFGVGHLSTDYIGQIKTYYNLTVGDEANGQEFNISDTVIEYGSFELVEPVSDSIYKSAGGVGQIQTSVVKEIAPLFFKQRNGITTKGDLYASLKALYPSYNIKIVGGDELPFNKVRLGTIFFMIYKNQNNILSNMEGVYQYSPTGLEEFNSNLSEIEKRLHMGTVMIFKDMIFSDIFIEANLKYNNSYNMNNIVNKIKTTLSNHFTNNDGKNYYLNKSYLQQVVVESQIDGMIDFDILNVSGEFINEGLTEPNIMFDSSDCGCSISKPFGFNESILSYGFSNIPYPFKLTLDMFNNIEVNLNNSQYLINRTSIEDSTYVIVEILQTDGSKIYFIRKTDGNSFIEICAFKVDNLSGSFSDINQLLYFEGITDVKLTFSNANELLYKYDILPVLQQSNINISSEPIHI